MSGKKSVIVVGGGLSGLSAAHTLIEGGVHVTLLEKNPFLGGNSTKATSGLNGAGSRTQAKLGIKDSYEVFLEDTVRSATGVKAPKPMPEPYPLAQVIAGNSADAVHWVQDNFGLALDTVSRLGGHTNQRTHRSKAGGKFPGMEITSALMKRYEELDDLENGTCELVINASAKKLLKDESGRVVGVEYVDGNGATQSVTADAVVLATGGFGAGVQKAGSFLEKIRPDLVHLPTTNGDHSQGDGIEIALGVGAKAIGLKHVQVHPTGLVNPDDPDCKTKFLAAEALRGEGGILLTNEGNRFCNDIGKRDYVTGRMWQENKAPYRLVLNSAAASNLQWHCKHYCSRRVMKHFKSGADLAKEMGIPTSQLQASFENYNEAARTGNDKFGKIYFTHAPFDINDSFYVAQVTPVVHYTMGGLAISSKAECVYEENNRVIPGLYAAGELAGGIHGRNRLGGSALLECVVFGRVAGSNALDYVHSPRPAVSVGTGSSTTTTISIPQNNGADPITITYTTTGAGQPAAGKAEGEVVDIIDWEDAVTTQVGKLTAGADGTEAGGAAAAPAAVAAATTGQDVAVVFGSFFMGDSKRDSASIHSTFPGIQGLEAPASPIEGNDFDFNSLAKTKFLVVCTSSMYGNPPANFWKFYYHLKAASENPSKPLKGLQHAVYGNGDETYIDTYMNVPRMVDMLLERAGSRRFFARGETSEPHAACGTKAIDAAAWQDGMWKAMSTASAKDAPVTWDAHWDGQGPNHHAKYTDWKLKKLTKTFGKPDTISNFSTPGARL
jgi:flavocytochrome c